MLPDFRLETFFSRWEFTARYHLCASDMESMSLSGLLAYADDELRQSWESLWLGYTETRGLPDLRDAIAATYEHLDARDMITFSGAEEGLYAAAHALLTAGDHAVVVTPNYQSAETVPMSICDVTGVALDPGNDWELDIDAVRAALRPNTRLLSINFPHNPTGKVIGERSLRELVELADARGIYIFSDEVYRLLERREALRLPQIADIYDRGVSLNVMSKAWGLAGLRIGWIATRDRELLARMERVKHYLSICNSAPAEILAIIALQAGDRILDRNRRLIDENLQQVSRFFRRYVELFDWYVPDGGCIGYPKFTGAEGVEAFCSRVVEETGVLLLPAGVYRSALTATPQDRFRIGFGRRHTGEALEVLDRWLQHSRAEN